METTNTPPSETKLSPIQDNIRRELGDGLQLLADFVIGGQPAAYWSLVDWAGRNQLAGTDTHRFYGDDEEDHESAALILRAIGAAAAYLPKGTDLCLK